MTDQTLEPKSLLTAIERAQRATLLTIEAKAAMAERERDQKRLQGNRERLKTERLAREAEKAKPT